jgi:predicted membrane protein
METLVNFEELSVKYRKTRKMKKTIFGILAVAAGVLLLGFNLNLINPEIKHIIFSWQMLLIAIGLVNIFDRDSIVIGAILLTTGSFFLVPEFLNVPFHLNQVFWPVILILAGLMAITKHRFHKYHVKSSKYWKHKYMHENFSASEISEAGTINQTNIFGGSKKVFNGEVFKGGEIANIFGGGELDLRNTTLAPGRSVLEVTNIFGGITIIVPADWVVDLQIDAIMGGFHDKRIIKPKSSDDISANVLVIKGTAIFGGGELKSF